MNTRYCYGCMKPIQTDDHMCGTCGFDAFAYKAEPHHLQPGTILHDRYLVGRVIGEGGFGITYVGVDTLLDRKVAVKEFYMKGFVNRNSTASLDVSVSTGVDAEQFEKNKGKFLDEARVLARFDKETGIVRIQDFFEGNNTAYMIMEFLEGETLRDHLKKTGPMPAQEVIRIMRPVMHSLHAVHEQNIIHRDISPDNIMVLNDGRIQLLDFGAARETSKKDVHSLSVILKPGYAPEEQYRSRGIQGPWTDVYALCATMYRCISGTVPDDSLERMLEDRVEPLSRVSSCPESVSSVIMKGLSVRKDGRYQTVDDLQRDLEKALVNPQFRTGGEMPGGHVQEAEATVYAGTTVQQARPVASHKVMPDQTVYAETAVQKTAADRPMSTQPQTTEHWKPALQDASAVKNQAAGKTAVSKKKIKTILAVGIPAAVLIVSLVLLLVFVILPKKGKNAEQDMEEAVSGPGISAEIEVGDSVLFGRYMQDKELDAEGEPVEWIVLAKEEGSILVISRDILDCQQYSDDPMARDVTWADSTLREWLNREFLRGTFSEEEQNVLIPAAISEAGKTTEETVFLLSVKEADQYFRTDETRVSRPTELVAYYEDEYMNSHGGDWWLRTAGSDGVSFAYVSADGQIVNDGSTVVLEESGIRPVVWINTDMIDAGYEVDFTVVPAGEETVEETPVPTQTEDVKEHVEETQADDPVDMDELLSAQVGDIVHFGRYEQDNDDSNGKERVEWIVLAKEGDRLLVISRYALMKKVYNVKLAKTTWVTSSLREALNGSFLRGTFNEEEQKRIPAVTVSADPNPEYNVDPGSDTEDRIFLLSLEEAEEYFGDNEARKCVTTKKVDPESIHEDNGGSCEWWLRTPGSDSTSVVYISMDGSIRTDGAYIYSPSLTVRPAMWIDLN